MCIFVYCIRLMKVFTYYNMCYFIVVFLIVRFDWCNFITFSFFTISLYVLYVKFIHYVFFLYVNVSFISLYLFHLEGVSVFLYLFLFVIRDFSGDCQYVFGNFFLWIRFIFTIKSGTFGVLLLGLRLTKSCFLLLSGLGCIFWVYFIGLEFTNKISFIIFFVRALIKE